MFHLHLRTKEAGKVSPSSETLHREINRHSEHEIRDYSVVAKSSSQRVQAWRVSPCYVPRAKLREVRRRVERDRTQLLAAILARCLPPETGMEPSSKKVGAAFSDDSSSSDEKGEFSYKNFHFRPKKKRRHDAGRRYARGVLYDSTVGITCHFCRQKTTRKHVYCRNCVLPLCGSCLRNRHGEVLELEVADDNWLCPRCHGGCGPGCKNCCNCTFCRKKQGLRPPKFAPRELSARGFDNVHDYLIHLETRESADIIWARKAGKGWCSSYEKKSANLSQESQQKMWGTSKESVDGSKPRQ
ncbi:hypothetical protein L7F22_005039 [Adiantum nelumboides]|nr:hypothetical protein [Adiantum nelumboides]